MIIVSRIVVMYQLYFTRGLRNKPCRKIIAIAGNNLVNDCLQFIQFIFFRQYFMLPLLIPGCRPVKSMAAYICRKKTYPVKPYFFCAVYDSRPMPEIKPVNDR